MNKLTLNNNDEDKKIITFTIDKELIQRLRTVLLNSEQYNLKKKSNWINEAVFMLRDNPAYKELIYHAEVNKNSVFDKIYMTFQQRCVFAEIRNNVVKEYPDIRGPQAAIIRAAIFSRLMRKL